MARPRSLGEALLYSLAGAGESALDQRRRSQAYNQEAQRFNLARADDLAQRQLQNEMALENLKFRQGAAKRDEKLDATRQRYEEIRNSLNMLKYNQALMGDQDKYYGSELEWAQADPGGYQDYLNMKADAEARKAAAKAGSKKGAPKNYVKEATTDLEKRRTARQKRETEHYKQAGHTFKQTFEDPTTGGFKTETVRNPTTRFKEPEITMEDLFSREYGPYISQTMGTRARDSIAAILGVPTDLPLAGGAVPTGYEPQGPATPSGGVDTRSVGYGPDGSFPTKEEYEEAKRLGLVD